MTYPGYRDQYTTGSCKPEDFFTYMEPEKEDTTGGLRIQFSSTESQPVDHVEMQFVSRMGCDILMSYFAMAPLKGVFSQSNISGTKGYGVGGVIELNTVVLGKVLKMQASREDLMMRMRSTRRSYGLGISMFTLLEMNKTMQQMMHTESTSNRASSRTPWR